MTMMEIQDIAKNIFQSIPENVPIIYNTFSFGGHDTKTRKILLLY